MSRYAQLRMIYRDQEQRRADLFYDIQKLERSLYEKTVELSETDRSLDEIQEMIKRAEEMKEDE